MRVVDTSAWIEFLIDSPLGQTFSAQMRDPAEIVVPTIVQFELTKWLTREVGEDARESMLSVMTQCLVVDLDTSVALRAAEVARSHRLATADAIIYATALAQEAELVTCDAHFKDLPGVIYFAKVRQ